MPRKKKKTLTVSRNVKGFPVALPMTHWFLIRQIYTWLGSVGGLPHAAHEASLLLPAVEIEMEEVEFAAENGWVKLGVPPTAKSKTLRIRADQVMGMIFLLRAVAAFHVGGQLGDTFRSRADMLESISVLDQLVDASR